MARGPAVISDNFDSYTDGLLQSVSGGNWRNWHDYMGRQSVASGAVATGATEDIGSVWTGASAGSLSVNQWAAVRLIAFEFENGWGGLLLRASTDYDDNGSNTRDAYELRVHDSNGTGTAVRTTQIVRVLNGAATVLTNIGVEWAPNDILIGEVEGADPVELRIYRDRGGTITLVATATDSDSSRITTYNRVGMCNRRGVTLDDFNAGNLVGLSISEVGNNDVIASDQAGVVITGAGFDVDAVEIRQGTTIVEQDIVDADDESIEFDVVFETTSGEDLKFGAATLAVINADEQEATHSITIVPPSGHLYVDVGTPNTTADNRITAVSDLASGDQLWARGVGGGAAPTGLQLNADATFQFSSGNTPASFDVRAWDASDSTWGDWATQSIVVTGNNVLTRVLTSEILLADAALPYAYRNRMLEGSLDVLDEAVRWMLRYRLLESGVSLTDEHLSQVIGGDILFKVLTSEVSPADELLKALLIARSLDDLILPSDGLLTAMQRFILLTDALSADDSLIGQYVPDSVFDPRPIIGVDPPPIVLGADPPDIVLGGMAI